jgi:hypothetical protein
MVAALVDTTNETESLLYLIDKASGVPVMDGYKFTISTSTETRV